MKKFISAFICFHSIARIHVATSLSQISHREPVANKMAKRFQTVLIIGSSPDRYALSGSYPKQTFVFKAEKLQHNAVFDQLRNIGIAVLQHPGVGLNGDLAEPFWNPSLAHALANKTQRPPGTKPESVQEKGWKFEPTYKVIAKAPEFARLAFGMGTPVDLVVVETSLWDLAGWWMHTGHVATPERIEQWCQKDLPYLLKTVVDTFNQSQVVFRTAPQVAKWNNQKWTQANLEAMHECVMRRSADGKGNVFDRVGVIDYHAIMDKLIARTEMNSPGNDEIMNQLWRPDGYHPAPLPGRLYINEILRLLDVEPLEAPDNGRHSLGEGEEIFVEDEDDF
jgi:hypothetical protein